MSNQKTLITGIVIVAILAAGGLFLWNWLLGSTEAASEPIQAVPLQLETNPTTQTSTTEVTPEPTGTNPTLETSNQSLPSGLQVYAISQDDSEVRFTIYEELFGQPNDVVGTSNQVAGEIAVNLDDLSGAQVGVIQVNARTLVTDENRRNQTIRNRILNTDSYEFITFTPTEIIGLDGSAAIGQTVQFQIAGDLTIRDVTKSVVFAVTAQANSADQFTGTATATILRSDFNLAIPSVPSVANVGEEVTLEIDFLANAN